MRDIANLSLEPSMDSACEPEEKVKVRLSGDWNVSGIGNYTPDDLDKGSIFGRLLKGSQKMGSGVTAKEQETAGSETGTVSEGDHQPEVERSYGRTRGKR